MLSRPCCAEWQAGGNRCHCGDVRIQFSTGKPQKLNLPVLFCTAACKPTNGSFTMAPHPDVGEGAGPLAVRCKRAFFMALLPSRGKKRAEPQGQGQGRLVGRASAGAAAVRGYGASAGSGVLPPTAERSTSVCCLRHTPALPRLSARWGRGFVLVSASLRACHRFDFVCLRRAGLVPLPLPLSVRSSGASPALRKPGSRGLAFP